jgi:hypothetical protein
MLNLAAVVATITMNILANALPLNGQNTGEISDRFKVFFVPAGYVFYIWGLIYVGFIAFAIYQALPAQWANPRLHRIGYLFTLSCLANIVWLFFWHYNLFSATILAMLALLLLLIAIYLRLDIGRQRVSAAEKWCVDIPFSIYLGWINVATIANATDLLYYWKWSGWGITPETWAFIMLVAGLIISSAVSLTRGDAAYLLVIVWAYVGIALKQAGVPSVAITAWLMAVLVVIVLVSGLLFRRRRAKESVAAG